jgi:hypothetical protein
VGQKLKADSKKCGEMPELAEGARLEIVCSGYPGTVGSNPTLSAILISHGNLVPRARSNLVGFAGKDG